MSVPTVKWRPDRQSAAVRAFLERPAFDAEAESIAARILSDVRAEGDGAVARYAEQFDGVSLSPGRFRVVAAELDAAEASVGRKLKAAIRTAHRRVASFARSGLRPDWVTPSPRGGSLGERFVPLDRVGVCVPGGAAPLVSSALMTVTLAKVAGVPEIVACTPCGPDGSINPALLHALRVAGATEVYRIGGIQAVGMMAYGTSTVARVRKIVGPGGTYVTAAKRQVYGYTALDLVAGPSEIAVLADGSARADWVAADLLSQAEHGTGWEKALLVTTSARLARETQRELQAQVARLPRRDSVRKVMERGMLLAVVGNLEHGVELCNRFAPEHLEIMVASPARWVKKVRCAGAVFVGPWSPECTGDYVAGPSHVLPTGGAAAMFSGLTVDDFRRRMSVIRFTRQDLEETADTIETLARVEGFEAHARSARIRFETERGPGSGNGHD
ncbi:histidinol dehydrogenase [Verrucomicrobiota bacterium]